MLSVVTSIAGDVRDLMDANDSNVAQSQSESVEGLEEGNDEFEKVSEGVEGYSSSGDDVLSLSS